MPNIRTTKDNEMFQKVVIVDSKTGYFPLKGLSTIDIDTEEDFQLVKRIMLANTKKNIFNKKILKN